MCKAAREMRHEVLCVTLGKKQQQQQEAKMHVRSQQQQILLQKLGPAQIHRLAALAQEMSANNNNNQNNNNNNNTTRLARRTRRLEEPSRPPSPSQALPPATETKSSSDDEDEQNENNKNVQHMQQQQQLQRPVASTPKPTRKHAQRNANATKHAQKSPRRTVFVEDVTVIEYDLSDEERMDKRQAFRAIGRRRHMKRLRPDFKDMPNDEFGEMMFASNSWRCDKPAHSETPPTPINVQYASGVSSASRISPPSSSNSPNSPLFLNGAQSHNATSSQRARATMQGHSRRHQHYPQIRRATNVTRVNNHSLAKRKRAASDVSYWDMFLATILFIKLLATVVLSTAGRSNTEEHSSRKSVTYA